MRFLYKVRWFFALLALISLLAFGCPVYELLGITCPCCGVTRAWLAFFSGDTALAFQYHLLFPVIPAVLFLFLFRKRTRFAKYADVFLYTVAAAVFLYNAMRWLGFVNMP